MDGSGDFRPEAERRASDPSLEEMLWRARAAHLGTRLGTTISNWGVPRSRWHPSTERQVTAVDWIHSVVVLGVGILLGVLMAWGFIQAGVLGGGAPTQGQTTAQRNSPAPPVVPTAPTVTPLPTSTSTPVPTPTDMSAATAVPAASPPTINEIVSLAQDFYNSLGPYPGTYVFMEATDVQLQSLDATHLTACIAFDFASFASPATVAGSDARTFVLNPISDSTWQVVEMGSAASCSLS